ncbi:NAD(P)-binding Rossmann-fold superfamily protein [Striga asiatica]|uniref:NAD(P)-binding Rossmann-fold superfamily protein n=1 Tax=Striga asiatica TaxID=4170 RepID=A0A5A7QVG9_STRAF|nr:NAD(P)-binding Rossmann-fold superfamily protein [Striga asiatica]
MNLVKIMVESFYFMCSVQFWRMALLWTLSLIFSYLDLFTQRFMTSKLKLYPRYSPKGSANFNSPAGKPVCIITGATSGLGAAAAYALSKEGFYVVLVGRSSERLSRAISAVKSGNQDSCLKAFEVDLSSFKSIIQFKHSLEQWLLDSKMHSSVQLLINNAGILATSRRLTSEGYDEMLATNYMGAFCLTKILLPLLQNSPVPSRVVNLTSFTHRNVCCMQANRETISGKSFVKSKSYPYAQIYEYSKCLTWKLIRLLIFQKYLNAITIPPLRVQFVKQENGYDEVSGVYFFGGNGRCLQSSRLSYNSRLAKDLWATSCNLFQELVLNF